MEDNWNQCIGKFANFIVAALIVFMVSCSSGSSNNLTGTSCKVRPDDATGFLQPICEYIVENLESYNVDPNTLQIEQVKPHTIQGQIEVYLDCCFTGDIAVLDESTKTVISFSLGDM